MRAALLVPLLLTACGRGPTPSRNLPELTLAAVDVAGSQFAYPAGSAIDLSPLPRDCVARESLRLANVGRANARFRISEASARFDYDVGPFDLASGQTMTLSVLIDPTGELPAGGALRHELHFESVPPFTLPETSFALIVPVLAEAQAPAAFDFGAVVVGAQGERPWNSLTTVDAGAFFLGDAGQLVFEPNDAGLITANVGWRQRAECNPVTVPLLGNGVDSLIESQSADVDFGNVRLGMSATRELVFAVWTNHAPSVQAVSDGGFLVEDRPSSSSSTFRTEQLVLRPAEHLVTVRFVPAFVGLHEGFITLSVAEARASVRVRGNGVP